MSGPLSAGERRTLAEMEQGLTVRPRNRDAGPCRAVSAAHGLGCDLVLAEHLVHHDPDGLWWAGCTLEFHQHGKETSNGKSAEAEQGR